MSDERDGERDDGPEGRTEPTDRQRDARKSDREEPLGELAAEVRERRGEHAPGERSPERRPSDGDRPDGSQREGPLAEVAAAVDERRSRKRDDADAFESVEVGELDGEQLWEELAADEGGQSVAVAPGESADAGASTGRGDASADRDVRTIPKATCHGCPYFGDPPELACTHEGTDILAMVDTDHFRVADCPMVVDGEEDIGSIAAGSDGES